MDKLLARETFSACNPTLLAEAARTEIDTLRRSITDGTVTSIDESALISAIHARYEAMLSPSLQPLILTSSMGHPKFLLG